MEFEAFNHSILTEKVQADLKKILRNPLIDTALSNSGYLAGGFVRSALKGDDIMNYLIPAYIKKHEETRPGDIDIFFEREDGVAACSNLLKEPEQGRGIIKPDSRSIGGFAIEKNISGREIDSSFNSGQIKVQLVDHKHTCGKPMLESVGNFDFTNCAVAMTKDKIFIPRGWREIEDDNLLDVVSSASPFLGGRILKYFYHRGFSKLTDSSRETILEWIVRSLHGKFEGYDKSHTAGIESHLKTMANNSDLVPTNDLTLFLGRWQTILNIDTSSGIYGPTHYVSVDFALNEINKRNNQASA